MPTYEDVLSLAKSLSPVDQFRLVEELSALLQPVEVEDSDELIPADEIAASKAALLDYRTGHDPGLSSTDLKKRLFGGKLG
jgi:hypothetical protein